MAAYATGADLLDWIDEQTLADLVSDTGTPAADVTSDPRVTAHLEAASGRVEAALTVAEQYSATDLEGLTGNSLRLLKQIVSTLALASILKRRPGAGHQDLYRATIEEAEEYLDRLRKGERVFGVPAVLDAGQPEVDGPTAAEIDRMNLITARVRHFYPGIQQRLPQGR